MKKRPREDPESRPAVCGSQHGVRRHRRHNEHFCRKCLRYLTRWTQQGKRRQNFRMAQDSEPICGRQSGLTEHRKRGEAPCFQCRVFRAAERKRFQASRLQRLREQYEGVRQPPTITPSCGTAYGHTKHMNNFEHPCQTCKDARNQASRERRSRKETSR